MYRNLHKYFIDLLTSHMIEYSSSYDSHLPRKRSWFESQLRNTNLYYFLVVFCLLLLFLFFFFLFFFFFFIFNPIDNPPISTFRYKITKGSRYFVLCTEILPFHTHHACITEQFLTLRMNFLCSKTCVQGIYYISHNLLFKMPQIATFIAHKNELLK